MTTVKIEIDGKKIEARSGSMLIEAADEAGFNIPRFCYHKKLSIAANCRMCLVEVEKAAKPLPACATPVTDGMKVFTRSPKAIKAQKGVMEFLLINHPLDCPICDQGGECELQDVALGYGNDTSRYAENKRIVGDKNIGPLIATDMTRCIHCTRCVRFGEEIAGVRELGATGRGEHMEIGTYIEQGVTSEMSGNVIDLCPVGALTSKPFRFAARAWEMTQASTIAAHDCIGSNVGVHVYNNRVMRVVPRDNEAINECWISDRDRFSYEGFNADDRLTAPMIKVNGAWQETDWNTALENVVHGIRKTITAHGADQIGCLVSPSATLEEHFLLQKLARGLGSANIDHRLRQTDFTDQDVVPAFPWLGQSLEALDTLDAALLVGANIRKDQPIAAHRVRKAAMNGAAVMCLNPVDYDFHFTLAEKLITSPRHMVAELAAVAKALRASGQAAVTAELSTLINAATPDKRHETIAKQLTAAAHSTVLLGNYANAHPQAASLRALAAYIAKASGSTLGHLSEGSNSAGAALAGVLPHRGAGGKAVAKKGKNVQQMIAAPLKAYLLHGIEPALDCANGAKLAEALAAAEYVVAMSAYRSPALEACADVLLPVAVSAETSGTFVNVEGRWQSFGGVVAPKGEARPAWKILRVLGNLFDVAGFEHITSQDVLDEARAEIGQPAPSNDAAYVVSAQRNAEQGVVRIAETPIYATDASVRRAPALQKTQDVDTVKAVRINRALAQSLGVLGAERVKVKQNGVDVEMPLAIDERVPDDCALIHAGLPETAALAPDFSPVTLHKA